MSEAKREQAAPRECAIIAAQAADEKKATDIMVQEVRERGGVKPLHREGSADGSWSLLDYGAVVIHVFQPETREYYRLETLWNDAPVLDLAAEAGLADLQYSDRIAKLLGKEPTE